MDPSPLSPRYRPEQNAAHRHLIQSPYYTPNLPRLHTETPTSPRLGDGQPNVHAFLQAGAGVSGGARHSSDGKERQTAAPSSLGRSQPYQSYEGDRRASQNTSDSDHTSPSEPRNDRSGSWSGPSLAPPPEKKDRRLSKRFKSALSGIFKKDEDDQSHGVQIEAKHWTEEDY